MTPAYQYLAIEREGDIFCVQLQRTHGEDADMEELGAEFGRLLDEENCRKLALILGPEDPECLVSLFLAKLINLQRRLNAAGGQLVLVNLTPEAQSIFQAAGIERFFRFLPDRTSALAALREPRTQ